VTGRHDQAERLLREMGEGSAAAFEQFYERFSPLVFSIAVRMVGDRMEAEDLCHDIFLEVYRNAGQYDPQRGSVEAWLAVKTRSRCLDRLRRKKSERIQVWDELPERGETGVTTEETVLAKLERETVRSVMNNIPEAQRRAVYGMYVQSWSHRELSERMERPLGTVKSLIRYGLMNVRKQLIQLGWIGPSGGAKERE
jgi:RNA polymerase sigma factor (sigma-70 family)